MLKKIKDKLYYYFAEKNWGVRREYGPYVDAHQEEHAKQPWKHWWLLVRLNWHYRVLRRENQLLWLEPEKQNKRRLPYLNGPESEISQRTLPVHLTMQLMLYDVISFDIFDTLLLRPFANPTDLFYIIGKRLDMPEFHKLRIEAEKRAREIAIAETGSREITIYNIYAQIEQKTRLPQIKGVEAEFEAELQYCVANPYMKQVFRMLQEQGKTIVITSDMYLPHDMMQQLLEKNGYSGFEKLYVSCDYGCNKHQKGLYKYLLRDYRGQKIVHVGDNTKADIKCAEECGIKTKYYKGVHAIGNPYRSDGMSELIGSAYSGIVNCHLHNGTQQYDTYYEYGFTYGGLYVFGFCNWIYQKARAADVEKILFLSRDGAIYHKVFSRFFSDVPSEYFLWSRTANTKYSFEHNGVISFDNAIQGRVRAQYPCTIGDMLDSLDLGQLKSSLHRYGFQEKVLITQENLKKIQEMLFQLKDEILSMYAPQKETIKEYIYHKVGTVNKIAIVDVGWRGTSLKEIKYIIKNELKLDCEVYCWMAGATSSPDFNLASSIADKDIEAYLFSNTCNRELFNIHTRTNHGLNHVFFEMLTQDCSPSYSGVNNDEKFLFQFPEVENYRSIAKIQQGIFDFCDLFFRTFCYDPYIYNISGYDAYLPFRIAVRNINFFRDNLSDFVFSRLVGGNEEETKTIYDLIGIANR